MDNINKNEQFKSLIKDLHKEGRVVENQKEFQEKSSEKHAAEQQNNITLPPLVQPIDNDFNGAFADNHASQVKVIENILADDLTAIYQGLSPDKQKEFKTKGEETARKISSILERGKVKFRDILNLIKKWLKLIPGINAFYLEQESKIKTYKIIKYNQNKKK